jgi:hypothetical protein
MKQKFLFLSFFLAAVCTTRGQTIKILFDGSHGETCSNADWIPDADAHNINFPSGGGQTCCSGTKSNAQQFPTPAQSGITASTPETYWEGGLSAWGVDCAKHNYQVESLPYNGKITYGDATNSQDLRNYNAFIICEPNIVFTAAEKTALMTWVQAGGGLFMISDHTVSDRNGDGWDSPAIWNDFLTNNTVNSNNPFGIAFDLANFSETTTNIASIPGDSCLHGPMGNVTQAKWSNGTSMTLDPTKNPSVTGVIYQTAATKGGKTGVMFAHARFGKGKIAAMGDSSPPDDGTGNPSCTLYNGYFTDASGNHQLLLMNATIWLVETNSLATVLNSDKSKVKDVSFFPNPAGETANLRFRLEDSEQLKVTICDLLGRELMNLSDETHMAGENGLSFSTSNLPAGVYFYRIATPTGASVGKFIVSQH